MTTAGKPTVGRREANSNENIRNKRDSMPAKAGMSASATIPSTAKMLPRIGRPSRAGTFQKVSSSMYASNIKGRQHKQGRLQH